ncbi:MAG TPA: Fe-S cluster assembly ATPase SufC [Candidatus Bilamarchaeaceae archaeon]|nr:Fe-S cluster assembly ATPase SufC [Candidatus Bilamarchaeaceae archaeon]
MFSIKNLQVRVDATPIIQGISMDIKEGEIHAVMGPNGAGKSSLASALMGHPRYKAEGQALLDGKDILQMPVNERARAGLFLAFQHPEEIEGVSIAKMMQRAVAGDTEKPDLKRLMALHQELGNGAEKLGMGKDFIKRDVNVGFSGGEKKKNEILQMQMLQPRMIILDEIDSGLDVDGLKNVAKAIESMRDGKRSFLMITHYRRILDYVRPDKVHILVKGKLVKSGGPELANEIDSRGYGDWVKGD